MEFLNALFTAAFDNNIVFAQLIAMVSVILVAQRPQDAIRMGGLLGISVAVAGIICWPLYAGFLLPWGVSYLAPLGCVLASTGAIFVGGTIMGAGKSSEERTRILRACTIFGLQRGRFGRAAFPGRHGGYHDLLVRPRCFRRCGLWSVLGRRPVRLCP